MRKHSFLAITKTVAGWVGIEGSYDRIKRTTFPQPKEKQTRDLIGMNEAPSQHDYTGPIPPMSGKWALVLLYKMHPTLDYQDDLVQRFQDYFAGKCEDFPDKLDYGKATAFQRKVWEATRLIPYGQTRSYNQIAQQIGKPGAARAVGQALAKNPLPIVIPCHRVLNSDGKLGGFNGGMEMKKHLLALEKADAGKISR